jgi:protein gp37
MTTIEWTDETYNPIVGCSKISAGCANCYAAEAAKSARLQQFGQYQEAKNWDGTTIFVESQLLKPLQWKKGRRIFVCSMSDLFHENTPFEWVDQVFAVMALCPQHTFQVLTKRPKRMYEYLAYSPWRRISYYAEFVPGLSIPVIAKALEVTRDPHIKFLPNVEIGVTVENQPAANTRTPILQKIPAATRFFSCEPLLENIELDLNGIDLVIVGGESGKGARVCHLDWIKSIVEQCQKANVAVFVKQAGSNVISSDVPLKLKNRKGGDLEELPENLRIRQLPAYR